MNLIELFENHGVPYRLYGEHHHTTQNWVSVDCPSCSPYSGRFRAAFNLWNGAFSCWSCGKANPVHALADICKISRSRAYEQIANKHAVQPQEQHHGGVYTPPTGICALQPQHRLYLQGRGFDPDQIENVWGVKGIGIGARLSWRLFIPIFDLFGKEVSWTTRAISDNAEQRYISAKSEEEKMPHKRILYGQHLVRSAMIICEGPLDAWAIGPGGVATCGVAYSEAQIAAMVDVPVRVVCFDTEPAAQQRAVKLCKELSAYPGVTENVILDTGKDPASASCTEIQELRSAFLK